MDLSFLRPLARTGPVATVVLDASHDTEDAERVRALRWGQARAQLVEQGADPATVAALEEAALGDAPAVGRAGRVLVGGDGRVLLDRILSEPPSQPRAAWASMPDLLPMLLQQPEPVPAVVVRIDDTGGEILLARPDESPEPAEQVKGSTHPVHKVRAGGWSHLNMQEHVEENWRRNTKAVAERVDVHVSEIGARLVVIAGDAPARSRLHDALGERAAALAVEVDHSAGATHEDLEAAVEAAVLDVADADRHAALDRYDQAAGRPDGLAVDGLPGVLAALRAEAVDTLLVDGGVERPGTLAVSDDPAQLATSADELRALGTEPTGEAGVDAALLRAAAATGCAFVPIGGGRTGMVGHPVADGVAAVLRYPVPTGG